MKLTEIAQAIKETGKPLDCWNLLIYGDPKTGKTQLAATIAKVPYIKRVHFVTLENGSETLITMLKSGALTQAQGEKIIVYDIPDTNAKPYGMETVMKMLTSYRNNIICEKHGRVDCMDCAARDPNTKKILKYNGQPFNLATMTHEDVVVIDNLSQLSRSILAWTMIGKAYEYKPGWDEFGPQGRVLADACGVMQACANTNFIATAHRISVEREENDVKIDSFYPSVGTRNFSMGVAGFFSHVLYVEMKSNQHKGGSSTQYRKDVLTGSRGGWKIEDQKGLDLSLLFNQLMSKQPVSNVVPISTNPTDTQP